MNNCIPELVSASWLWIEWCQCRYNYDYNYDYNYNYNYDYIYTTWEYFIITSIMPLLLISTRPMSWNNVKPIVYGLNWLTKNWSTEEKTPTREPNNTKTNCKGLTTIKLIGEPKISIKRERIDRKTKKQDKTKCQGLDKWPELWWLRRPPPL